MAKATGKDHARINLDIWGDDDWLDLTPPAQHLYFVLWTSPQLSYCGTGEWHPGKIASKAKGWTAHAVDAAAVELCAELFLVIDADTEEFLLRSWMKHDGLWRTPNMAVSMANARAELSSRILRGVVVHEVAKIKARQPDSTSWERHAVVTMLSQKAVDPATLERYKGLANSIPNSTSNPGSNGGRNGGSNPYGHHGVNPGSNGASTPAPSPLPLTPSPEGGYVSREPHQGVGAETPRPHCPDHEENYEDGPCRPCERRRKWDEANADRLARDELEHKRAQRATAAQALKDCPLCDDAGWTLGTDGTPIEPAVKCKAHLTEAASHA